MAKKLETISLQGKAYAQVAVRIKEFREMCPNGLIDTTPTFQPDGSLTFKARILKDKSVTTSGEGTGNSRGFTKDPKTGVEQPKAFEKLETIAVGRALAMLGFMASGEVASFEEMEEFTEYQKTQQEERVLAIIDHAGSITDLAELREYYKTVRGNGKEVDSFIMERAEQLKTNIKDK